MTFQFLMSSWLQVPGFLNRDGSDVMDDGDSDSNDSDGGGGAGDYNGGGGKDHSCVSPEQLIVFALLGMKTFYYPHFAGRETETQIMKPCVGLGCHHLDTHVLGAMA